MRLVSVQIKNYRSIQDSGKFSIADVTCLVGKNEAGKTAVLQALYGLNPHRDDELAYNSERDYPRTHLNDYENGQGSSDICETEWELDESDISELEKKLGPKCLTSKVVIVTSRYGDSKYWSIPVDHQKVLKNILGNYSLDAVEISKTKNAASCKILAEQIEETDSEKLKKIKAEIDTFRERNPSLAAIDVLKPLMPKFFYSSHYDRMSGQVSINQIESDKAAGIFDTEEKSGDRVFLDFLEYAGTTLKELKEATTFESLNSKCESASTKITDQIFEYWSQNKYLEVSVNLTQGLPDDKPPFNSGAVARARVKNNVHRMSVPFSERSAGFIWFFSFLVTFSQLLNKTGNVILLLDEPGLTLHGKAQHDLMRYFNEKLRPKHQVLYTTHSPFMVPAQDLMSVRTVEDKVDHSSGRPRSEGTKVREDVLSTDSDTVFPLQGALGVEITQSLFVGENTLLVEGPSEILYFEAFSAALRRRDKDGLSLSWTVCPAGSIDKIMPFLSLFAGNMIETAVLTDVAKGQKGSIDRIKKSGILKEGRLFGVSDFCEKTEADIEDLLEPQLYCELINRCYELKTEHQLTPDSLAAADPNTERMAKQAEAYFKLLPDEYPLFSHFEPAAWLIKNIEVLDQTDDFIEMSIERFRNLFAEFNKLLEK